MGEKPLSCWKMAADFENVAKAFTTHYYNTFDQNRAALSALYNDSSMMSFEGHKIMGKTNIHAKLTEGLNFQRSRHRLQTVDAHPSPNNGVLVSVGGEILVDDEEKPLRFSQVFNLQPIPGQQGGFFILSDLFRLHYG